MWQRCLPTQIDMFQENQVDVFCHFWDVIEDAEKQAILKLLNPKAYLFEKPQDFSALDVKGGVKIPDNINIPSRMASQYYSWRAVARLFEPLSKDYNFAVRTRSDLQFVYSIEHIFPQLKPKDIVMPWWQESELLSDIFAFGDIDIMLHYHKMFDYMMKYAETEIFNSEVLLMHHMKYCHDAHIITDNRQYYFVRRPHMDMYTIEQCLQENPGRNKWLDPEVVDAHKGFYKMRAGDIGLEHIENFRSFQLDKLREEIAEKTGSDKSD